MTSRLLRLFVEPPTAAHRPPAPPRFPGAPPAARAERTPAPAQFSGADWAAGAERPSSLAQFSGADPIAGAERPPSPARFSGIDPVAAERPPAPAVLHVDPVHGGAVAAVSPPRYAESASRRAQLPRSIRLMREQRTVSRVTPPRCAVLGPSGADAVAAGLAVALRRQARAPAAVVVVASSGSEGARGVDHGAATRAARRVASTLDGLGVDAVPRGGLVWAPIGVADARGSAAVERVAALDVPQVLLLASARTEALEDLLAGCDLLVHVTRAPESPLAALVAADAGRSGAPPLVSVPPLAWAARVAVRSGRVVPRRLGRVVAEWAEGVMT